MGRPSERKPLETVWLCTRIQRFYDAQSAGQLVAFFNCMIEEWYTSFPFPGGLTDKEKGEMSEATHDMIHNWFYNNSDKYASGKKTMPVGFDMPQKKTGAPVEPAANTGNKKGKKNKDATLDLQKKADKKVGLQLWQVYQIMFRNKIKGDEKQEYAEYCEKEKSEGRTPASSIFARDCDEETEKNGETLSSIKWNATRIKARFDAEEPHIKQRVKDRYKDYRDGKVAKIKPDEGEDEDDSYTADDEDMEERKKEAEELKKQEEQANLAKRINAIPQSMQRVLVNLHEQTGWCGAILVGGPDPSGEVAAVIFAEGKTRRFGNTWPESDPDFYANVVPSFQKFLKLAYPSNATEGDVNVVVDNTLSFSFDAPGKDKSRSRSTEGHTETSPSASSTSGSSKEKSNRKRSLDDVDYSSSETDTDSTVSVGEDRTVRGGQKSSAEKRDNAAMAKPLPDDSRASDDKTQDSQDRSDQASQAPAPEPGSSSNEMGSVEENSAALSHRPGLGVTEGLGNNALKSVRDPAQSKAPGKAKPRPKAKAAVSKPEGTRRETRSTSKASPVSVSSAPTANGGLGTSDTNSAPSFEKSNADSHSVEPVALSPKPLPKVSGNEQAISQASTDAPTLDASMSSAPNEELINSGSAAVTHAGEGTTEAGASRAESSVINRTHDVLIAADDAPTARIKRSRTRSGGPAKNKKQNGDPGRGETSLPHEIDSTSADSSDQHAKKRRDVCPDSARKPAEDGTNWLARRNAVEQAAKQRGSQAWLRRGEQTVAAAWERSKNWVKLAERWARLEDAHSGQKDGDFPLENAPWEVLSLLELFAAANEVVEIPSVYDGGDYGQRWWTWWRSLQPDWRFLKKNEDRLVHELPAGKDLSTLLRTGQKGLFLVLLGLAIFANAEVFPERAGKLLKYAKVDVEWVLMILDGTEPSLKRSRMPGPGSGTSQEDTNGLNGASDERPTKRPRRGVANK